MDPPVRNRMFWVCYQTRERRKMSVWFDSLAIITAVMEVAVKWSVPNAKSCAWADWEASSSLLLGGLALKHVLAGSWLADRNAWITRRRVSSEQTVDDFWVSLVGRGCTEVTQNGKWCGIKWMSLASPRRAEAVSSAGRRIWILCHQRGSPSKQWWKALIRGAAKYPSSPQQGPKDSRQGCRHGWPAQALWQCSFLMLYLIQGKSFSSLGKSISLLVSSTCCWDY